MGVDFYTCKHCGDTFPDCGHYVNCNTCYRHWCSDECANKDGLMVLENDEDYEADEEEVSTCKYCRKEAIEDCNLVEYLLDKYNLTREQAVKDYWENKNNEQLE